MRTAGAITNQSGYPYQWIYIADYSTACHGDTSPYSVIMNPLTMRAVTSRENPTALLTRISQANMRTPAITYPYDFSDRTRYQRRTGQRAPYGL
jgi:hypothetical protein